MDLFQWRAENFEVVQVFRNPDGSLDELYDSLDEIMKKYIQVLPFLLWFFAQDFLWTSVHDTVETNRRWIGLESRDSKIDGDDRPF